MFTELIDTLRCPNDHDDSWLVATSTRSDQRHIVEGRLGCPVCRQTFLIVDGVAQFRAPVAIPPIDALDEDAAFRIAAQLHLVEAPSPILLTGRSARCCAGVAIRGHVALVAECSSGIRH
ncbi:MAG: hypothetical protein U5K74_05630 [Gemmatimonadaceae bacterium]|nr:hypothetical protein [Gemmatimonadaceae bacterium]